MRRIMNLTAWRRLKLWGYYKFSDLNDSTINPANLSGSGTYSFVAGKLGNAVEFISNSALRIFSGNKYSFSDGTNDIPFSFSCWIYYKGGGGSGNRHIFGRNMSGGGSASTNSEYQFYIERTTAKLCFIKYSLGNNLNYKIILSTSVLTANTWYHIAYTDDAMGNEKFYINSVLSTVTKVNGGTGYIKMSITSSNEGFGNSLGIVSSLYAFYGILDDFSIFKNKVLSQKDVEWIYNGGVGRQLK